MLINSTSPRRIATPSGRHCDDEMRQAYMATGSDINNLPGSDVD